LYGELQVNRTRCLFARKLPSKRKIARNKQKISKSAEGEG